MRLQARTPAAFATWVALYVLLVVLPLPLGLIDLDPGRGFAINFSVALGFVGLSMFGLQFLMGARSAAVLHPVGVDLVLRFHREMAYVATLFVFAHPIILFVLDSRFTGLLNVFTAPLRAQLGVTALIALLVLIGLSVFRRGLHIRYETWQLTHALLALLVVATALSHALLVGYYVREPWEQALWIAMSAGFVCLGVWVRLVKPLLGRRRKWVVREVGTEPGGAATIELSLVDRRAYGPRGFRFEPGQFAWLLARRSPFSMDAHPFSFSSSAEHPEHVRFTIKPQGGFTHTIGELKVGEHVYLDGPFGAFVLPEDEPLVAIGAGVGVTPLLSMLETLADRGSTLPAALWLGNHDEATIACRAQIDALRERLPIDVVHVLSAPGPDWAGEVGHIDAAFVARRLEELGVRAVRSSYCICGPDAMMDAVQHALAVHGVPGSQIHAERFGGV